MVLDNSTKQYFDGKFENVHERINDTREIVIGVKQEVKDLKGNGYFVKPAQCQSLHASLTSKLNKTTRLVLMMVGGLVVLSVLLPFIIEHLRGPE